MGRNQTNTNFKFIVSLTLFQLCVACNLIKDISSTISQADADWQSEFDLSGCNLITQGQNDYFILEPGFQLILEGGNEKLVITVLDEIVEVDGVLARVVEERETKNGELFEVSRNFFAICEETLDVYYFGEDVDMVSGGVINSHSGAWRAGERNARAGLMMAGDPKEGMKYYQEIAPDVAMDRAEVLSLEERLITPAGEYTACLKIKEGTALNPLEVGYKTYASGIGMIQDERLLLVSYGYVDEEVGP
jgi:hypothetical protein